MKLTENLYFYPETGMLDCNTYVIRDEVSILIDPELPQAIPALAQEMRKDGIEPEDINIITNTHLHIDHSGGNEAFKEISGAEIVLHPLHKKFYDLAVDQTSRFFGLPPLRFEEDRCLDDSKLGTGTLEIEFISSPGHSPDSICLYCPAGRFLACGDVIFDKNTGRIDLPGGSSDELKQSIEQLSRLDIEYLLPGHMDIVNGVQAVKDNFEIVKKQVFPWL